MQTSVRGQAQSLSRESCSMIVKLPRECRAALSKAEEGVVNSDIGQQKGYCIPPIAVQCHCRGCCSSWDTREDSQELPVGSPYPSIWNLLLSVWCGTNRTQIACGWSLQKLRYKMPMAAGCLYSSHVLWSPPSGEQALGLRTAPLRSWGCGEPKSLANSQQMLLCGLSGQSPQLSTWVTIFAENTLNIIFWKPHWRTQICRNSRIIYLLC